jgi:hypothetical protein
MFYYNTPFLSLVRLDNTELVQASCKSTGLTDFGEDFDVDGHNSEWRDPSSFSEHGGLLEKTFLKR